MKTETSTPGERFARLSPTSPLFSSNYLNVSLPGYAISWTNTAVTALASPGSGEGFPVHLPGCKRNPCHVRAYPAVSRTYHWQRRFARIPRARNALRFLAHRNRLLIYSACCVFALMMACVFRLRGALRFFFARR